MTKEKALELLNKYLQNKNTIKHSLAVESIMRDLAIHFDEDPEIWGMAGLFHDLDYEMVREDWTKHGLVTEGLLKEFDLPKVAFDIIKAHNAEALGIVPTTLAEKAIYAADPLSGLITACALMNPEKKIRNVELSSIMKKFKNLKFAAGANRDQIKKCEDINLKLDEFIALSLKAMQSISTDLGL